ncbi:MAG: hypothetical protein KAS72_15865 [Phycisphaerales bacterium]|nr:hypothetical protein [Phycisphaerales bacterium]
MRHRQGLRFGVLAAIGLAIAGCASPYMSGGSYKSADTFTYVSTPYAPKTITVLDTRTGDEIWSVDIPVGSQLTMQFVPGKGEDTVYLQDLMRYHISDEHRHFGPLASSVSVPDQHSRRVVMTLRPVPEFAPTAEE